MTKYDIRLRRKSLTSGQIERHKDFRGLYKMEQVERKSSVYKVVAIVAGLLIIVGMITFGILKTTANRESVPTDQATPDVFEEFKSE